MKHCERENFKLFRRFFSDQTQMLFSLAGETGTKSIKVKCFTDSILNYKYILHYKTR